MSVRYIDMIIERDYGDETFKSQTFEVNKGEGEPYDYNGIKVSYEV